MTCGGDMHNIITTEQMRAATRADPKFTSFVELKLMKEINMRINGKFFLITYTHDHNREEDFIDFILDNMEFYSLTNSERKKMKCSRERLRKAYRRFVKYSTTGEFGEMILFFILELFENAIQVINKMALKTTGKKHYNGADCVHFGVKDNLRILFMGESKTTESTFNSALSSSLESITLFYEEKKDKFEVDLISGNISEDIPLEIQNMIKDYIDPLKPDKTDCCQINAVFLGFEESFLRDLEKSYAGDELLRKVTEKYNEKIAGYIKTIESKVKNCDISDQRFFFFLLPFKDLDKARKKFTEELKIVQE